MTKISQYPEIATPDVEDLLIGTDVENSSNATKNFTIQSIIDLVPGGTGVISTSDNKTMYSTNPAAGVPSVGLSDSIFLGNQAGYAASAASNSNFFGSSAGQNATNASNSNFFGQSAGFQASSATYSNFLGFEAGKDSTGNNVNAFGSSAGKDNTLSGQTIFSNSSLPSYTDRAAAVAAITVLLGASAGDTYLYYNQTTFGIEAVRL